jgi:hypothetical protein
LKFGPSRESSCRGSYANCRKHVIVLASLV